MLSILGFMSEPQSKCCINVKEFNDELCYRASCIDGFGISLSEYITNLQIEHSSSVLPFSIFCFEHLYELLAVCVQTKTEEHFFQEIDKLWNEYKKLDKSNQS